MFISEATAQERIRSSQNILNRVKRDDAMDDLGKIPLPAVVPSVDEEGVVGEESAAPIVEILPAEDSDPISPKGLAKLLAGDEEQLNRRRRTRTLEEQSSIGLTAALISSYAAERMHDVSHMQANNYEHGHTSTDARMSGKSPKEELQRRILEKNGLVVDMAFERLMKSLELMDDDKLAKIMKPEVLARIAGDMHRIVTNATPKDAEDSAQGVHFHIWKPEVKEESHYKVVTVGGGGR
jgi:hypothetical protein